MSRLTEDELQEFLETLGGRRWKKVSVRRAIESHIGSLEGETIELKEACRLLQGALKVAKDEIAALEAENAALRSLMTNALDLIEENEWHACGVDRCPGCGEWGPYFDKPVATHKPDCVYVSTVAALRAALAPEKS